MLKTELFSVMWFPTCFCLPPIFLVISPCMSQHGCLGTPCRVASGWRFFFGGPHLFLYLFSLAVLMHTLSPYFHFPCRIFCLTSLCIGHFWWRFGGGPQKQPENHGAPDLWKGEKDERWRYDVVDSLILGSDLSMLLRMVYRDEWKMMSLLTITHIPTYPCS